jgi:DNA helicase-2/ATP-dependent DNA helicase PcrA
MLGMEARKTQLIVGPPGTGKTTRLLNILDGLFSAGIPPEQVCFLAFTRKAAYEARERAIQKFGLSPDRFPYFRTCHSLAFHQLGLTSKDVMGFENWLEIAKLLGVSLTLRGTWSEEGNGSGMTRGDRTLFLENMARMRRIDVGDLLDMMPDEDITMAELIQFRDTLAMYKKARQKLDFTDMIDQFCDSRKFPNVKILVVDEAQDLSPAQWRLIEHLSREVNFTYLAGDDDQAIFKWAGADPDTFIDLPGAVETLAQSWRIPSTVHEIAGKVILDVKHRRDKMWHPRKEVGRVEWHTSLDDIDASEGTWLLLARNVFLLPIFHEWCMQRGHMFESAHDSPVPTEMLTAIKDWEALRAGSNIMAASAKNVYNYIRVRQGVKYGFKQALDRVSDEVLLSMDDLRKDFGLCTKLPWYDALDRIPEPSKMYITNALAMGERIGVPRIRISTIHSVKGGEADHVVLLTDMAQRTYQEYEKNRDDEARVWYVAVTRAKQSLHVVAPVTNLYYEPILLA